MDKKIKSQAIRGTTDYHTLMIAVLHDTMKSKAGYKPPTITDESLIADFTFSVSLDPTTVFTRARSYYYPLLVAPEFELCFKCKFELRRFLTRRDAIYHSIKVPSSITGIIVCDICGELVDGKLF